MDIPNFSNYLLPQGDKAHGLFQRTPALDGSDVELRREEIRRYFHTTSERYEQLFETLVQDEAFFRRPIALRHPLIFYFGHTATFFINKLIIAGLIKERINPHFESMLRIPRDSATDSTAFGRVSRSEATQVRR